MKEQDEIFKELQNFWQTQDKKINEKFKNINGKSSKYYVPNELYQKRTKRSNRSLISWKEVKDNKLEIKHLETMDGGVVVEFKNDDYFCTENNEKVKNKKKKLLEKLGSDEKVSAILTFRNEDGDSGTSIPRKAYKKFKKTTKSKNIEKISRKDISGGSFPGSGNEFWKGALFVSIKGGEQESIETHKGKELKLFNPAIEYASESTSKDIYIVLSFFALHCKDIRNVNEDLKKSVEDYLKQKTYNKINLFDYSKKHPTLFYSNNHYLIDPIQMKEISINSFNHNPCDNSENIVLCHDTPANQKKFIFDNTLGIILSPANPTNLFWNTHLSNMMQQNKKLEDYFREEEERCKKRKNFKKKDDH